MTARCIGGMEAETPGDAAATELLSDRATALRVMTLEAASIARRRTLEAPKLLQRSAPLSTSGGR